MIPGSSVPVHASSSSPGVDAYLAAAHRLLSELGVELLLDDGLRCVEQHECDGEAEQQLQQEGRSGGEVHRGEAQGEFHSSHENTEKLADVSLATLVRWHWLRGHLMEMQDQVVT